MKPLGIKAKVALATSITSVLMIGLVTLVQTQRMQEDYMRVMFTQQTALVTRTAQELDDKLTMLLDIIALSARNQPADLADSTDKLRAYYQNRAVLSLFEEDPRRLRGGRRAFGFAALKIFLNFLQILVARYRIARYSSLINTSNTT